MKYIKSTTNPLIKSVARLLTTSGRKKSGKFIIEGRKLCLEALDSNILVEHCFILEGFDRPEILNKLENIQIIQVTLQVMKKMSSLTTAQDILMVAKIPEKTYKEQVCDVIIALDRVADPHNIGAILRTAEAFGINNIVMSPECADLYSTKVLRGAMGSVFRLNTQYTELISFLNLKKEQGYKILGAGINKQFLTVDKLISFEKSVIVIGNESTGISSPVMQVCDSGLFIPMIGKNESLNAAVAASIIMWEWQRQRARL